MLVHFVFQVLLFECVVLLSFDVCCLWFYSCLLLSVGLDYD